MAPVVTWTDWKPRGGEEYLSPPLGLFSIKTCRLRLRRIDRCVRIGIQEETKTYNSSLVSRSSDEKSRPELDQFGSCVARAICSEYADMLEV